MLFMLDDRCRPDSYRETDVSGPTELKILSGVCHKDLGGLAQGSHLFPSRTEKLSPAAPMVLGLHPGE